MEETMTLVCAVAYEKKTGISALFSFIASP